MLAYTEDVVIIIRFLPCVKETFPMTEWWGTQNMIPHKEVKTIILIWGEMGSKTCTRITVLS